MKNIFLNGSEKTIYSHKDNQNLNGKYSVIGIGGSSNMPSILLPSYILGGIDSLCDGSSDKLNICIASNLSALINNFSISQSCDVGNSTKIFLEQFIQEFYSEFANKISIDIDTLSKAEEVINYARTFLDLYGGELISSLTEEEKRMITLKNKKYLYNPENLIQESDLLYPVCHPHYENMFNNHCSIIKIGGRIETLFNSISTHILNIEKPHNTIIQRITKSGKSPLYYGMRGEPLLGKLYDGSFEDIKCNAPMRQFDCEIIAERIKENEYLEFYNDTMSSLHHNNYK